VQLSVLARATVPILERYYLVVSLLLKAGSGRLSQDALERQCQLMAQRMALLYEINSPEFFDRALFQNFLGLLRKRQVLSVGDEDRLEFEPAMLEAIGRLAAKVKYGTLDELAADESKLAIFIAKARASSVKWGEYLD
jgi:glycerol-3-phosphate O-acyltransferase